MSAQGPTTARCGVALELTTVGCLKGSAQLKASARSQSPLRSREQFSTAQPTNSKFFDASKVNRISSMITFATSEPAEKRGRRKAAGELAVEGPVEMTWENLTSPARLCADRGFGKCVASSDQTE
jgi:hypothetical protein